MPAILNSLAAADSARRVFATEQAEAHYNAALELLAQRPDARLRARACEGLGDMLTIRTHYAEAVEAYLDALVDTPIDRAVARARVERKIAYAHMRGRDADAASQAFARAERLLSIARDSNGATAEEIQIGLDRLTLLYWQNDSVGMGRVISRIRPLVESHGNPGQQLRLLDSMLAREMRRRRFRLTQRSVELARRALAAAEAAGDPARLPHAVFQLGFSLLWASEPDEALLHLERALELSTRDRDLMLQTRALTYMTVAHRKRGSTGEVDRTAKRALDASNAARLPEYQAMAYANLAWVAARRRDFAKARNDAETALGYWAKFPFKRLAFFLEQPLWPLIAAALSDGDLDAAIGYAQQLLDAGQRPLATTVRRLVEAAIEHETAAPSVAAHELQQALELADGLSASSRPDAAECAVPITVPASQSTS